MFNSKIFRATVPEDIKKFEEISGKYPDAVIKGMNEYVMITFEDGEIMTKEHKILHLTKELNVLLKNEIDDARAFLDTFPMLETIDFYSRRKDYEEFYTQMRATRKNAELGQYKIEVIIKDLAKLGKKVEPHEHPELPPMPEKPIIAEVEPKNNKKK